MAVYDDGLAWCEAGHGKHHGHPEYKGVSKSMEKQKIKDKPNLEWLDSTGKWDEKGISNATLTEWVLGQEVKGLFCASFVGRLLGLDVPLDIEPDSLYDVLSVMK